MQKKIIALAIASALTAPAMAFADSANANFYGILSADVEMVKAGTAGTATSPDSRGRITSDASRLGVNGSDDLGNGMSAIYQLETRVNLTGTETSGGTNLGLFDGIRNSNLGLKGNFGTAFVGQWDTPFKTSHNKIELFDNTTIATSTALLGSISAGNSGGQNLFTLRQGSSIQYWTPDLSGFQIKAAYSTRAAGTISPGTPGLASAASTAAVGTDTANNNGTPRVVSVSGAYDAGPFYVALAYEQHKAAPIAAAAALTDKGERLVGAYTIDAFQVGLTYEKLTVGAATGDLSRNAYSLEGKYNMPAAGTVAATYTKAGNFGGVSDTGATQISLRYGYMMSKRTELYAMYTDINNKAKANYNFSDVGQFAAATGSKVSGYGAGIRHTF